MRITRTGNATLIAAACVAWLAEAPRAQGAWPDCPDVADADIKVTEIVTRGGAGVDEPMKMAFELTAGAGEDAKDRVNVYFTERKGRLRKYDAAKKQTLTLHTFTGLSIGGSSSDGLMGIALDPGFKSNHHLYLYYTAGSGSSATWRVARFTLDPAHEAVVANSEKVLLDIPIQLGAQHPGGALQFDAYGDLWITTGDNHLPGGSGFYVHTSGNSNDLRGKILRIRPRADGGGYDIPEGNLFPKGMAKTRPEIYVMGTRNAYSLSLDPVRRWAVWGDVGPDDKTMDGAPMNQPGSSELTEELNLATGPGNFGYPFFVGNNFALKTGVDPASPAIPAGTSWNGAQEGIATLPPAIPAIKPYKRACAITGPIYRYDGDLNSSIKFPPHFHRKWLTTDFNATQKNVISLHTLNADGTQVTASANVLNSVTLYRPLDMQFGPDGALYVSNYSGYRSVTGTTGIIRVEYAGSCRPAEPKLETAGLARGTGGGQGRGPRIEILGGRSLSVSIASAGAFTLQVKDFLGRPVARRTGRGDARLDLDEVREPGVYVLVAESAQGRTYRTLVRD